MCGGYKGASVDDVDTAGVRGRLRFGVPAAMADAD